MVKKEPILTYFNTCETSLVIARIYQIVTEQSEQLTQSELLQRVVDELPDLKLSKNKVGKIFKLIKKQEVINFEVVEESKPACVSFSAEIDSQATLFDLHDLTIMTVLEANEIVLDDKQKGNILISEHLKIA